MIERKNQLSIRTQCALLKDLPVTGKNQVWQIDITYLPMLSTNA